MLFQRRVVCTKLDMQWNLSNMTHQGTREMCRIVQDVRTCLIRHTKGPEKCVGLYRVSEYSDFILVNTNILGPSQDVRKLRCRIAQVPLYMFYLKSAHISTHTCSEQNAKNYIIQEKYTINNGVLMSL
jgi:hypothetical protein